MSILFVLLQENVTQHKINEQPICDTTEKRHIKTRKMSILSVILPINVTQQRKNEHPICDTTEKYHTT